MVSRPGTARRIIRTGAGAVATAALAWTACLLLVGGLDTRAFGLPISSHDPLRPLLIAALALTIFMFLGGDDVVVRGVLARARRARRGWSATARWRARAGEYSRAGHLDRAAIGIIAVVAVAVGIVDGSKAAGGSDAYGYLSEADLWRSGHLSVPQPWMQDVPWPDASWTFAPLGYTPSRPRTSFSIFGYRPSYDPQSIVPAYSPGLPMIMAMAARLGGECAKYWVVPLSGGALLLAVYGLGVRLGSRRLGTTAAFLVATSPPFIEFQMVTMTEVPVTAAWALACWGILGRSIRSACGAAVALAAAILIRPNLAPLVAVIACWLVFRVVRGVSDRPRHLWRAAIVLAGAAAGIVTVACIYWSLYGSPLESGYGPTSNLFAWAYVPANITKYAEQFLDAQTMAGVIGLAALFVPAKRLWPGADRATVIAFAMIVVSVWAEFCCYLVSDTALRFLLPCYPFVMLGLASAALFVARSGPRGTSAIVVVIVLLLGARGVDQTWTRGAFLQWSDETLYIDAAEQVRATTPENSVIIAMQHSGSARYYAGRVTLRWDYLSPDWLDRSVAWLADRHVPTYVFIDLWERDLIRKRFAGQSLAARLDAPPMFTMANRLLYDMTTPAPSSTAARVLPADPRRGRCVPAVAIAVPNWKR